MARGGGDTGRYTSAGEYETYQCPVALHLVGQLEPLEEELSNQQPKRCAGGGQPAGAGREAILTGSRWPLTQEHAERHLTRRGSYSRYTFISSPRNPSKLRLNLSVQS